MPVEEVHVGDIGTVFTVTVADSGTPVDISAATTIEIIFGKPYDNASVTKTAVFVTDGTDGKIKYTTVANDLNIAGPWEIQARITLPTGTWRSEVGEFTVHENA